MGKLITKIDEYWSEHVVKDDPFGSLEESQSYAKWRYEVNTSLHEEFLQTTFPHIGEVVLDYGCGVGNDLVHFIKSGAKKIIAADISVKALNLAQHQVSLYVNGIPIEYIHTSDGITNIPLKDNSIDYIHCAGVLHHTTDPLGILKEFYRILKYNSSIRIMVYNRNSILFHIHIAYICKGGFKGNNIDKIFNKSTDGVNCPISRTYIPNDFIELCNSVGFKTEFIGGYFTQKDTVGYFNKYRNRVLNESRLNEEHKSFIHAVKIDDKARPTYDGKCCGINGVYKLHKATIK